MDGGQWGDAMNAIREVRDRLDERMDRIEAEQHETQPTLRDRFAMAALAGAMPAFFEEGSSWEDYDDMAGTCYQVADAMLRARDGK